MSTLTSKLNLICPEVNDVINVSAFSSNFLAIDNFAKSTDETIEMVRKNTDESIKKLDANKINSTLLPKFFKLKSQTRDITQPVGDNYWEFNDIPQVDGYTRMVYNVTISGTNSSYMNAYAVYASPTGVRVNVRNFGSSNFVGKIRVDVWYISVALYSS